MIVNEKKVDAETDSIVGIVDGLHTSDSDNLTLADTVHDVNGAISAGFTDLAMRVSDLRTGTTLVDALHSVARGLHGNLGDSLTDSVLVGSHEIAESILELAKAIREAK